MEVRVSSTIKFWLANNRQFDAPKVDIDSPDLKYSNVSNSLNHWIFYFKYMGFIFSVVQWKRPSMKYIV